MIQITGRSFRLRGHRADKKGDQAAVDEAETQLENELKTGQTRSPGPTKKTTKKPTN